MCCCFDNNMFHLQQPAALASRVMIETLSTTAAEYWLYRSVGSLIPRDVWTQPHTHPDHLTHTGESGVFRALSHSAH